ncbi:IclR family transcriptional regulator domain-containing protein [Martelella mangrovi]|uniref:DNA-binding IclR family transcriptional regulator/sugar lactone lactonase YvrE n=1 Tax=Martelella mangrovi TaxID=1397477 RepID=A0ABV2ID48_9HYPH
MDVIEQKPKRDARAQDVKGAGLLTKACDILDLVGRSPGRLASKDLVEATGLSKSTVYRIVSALSTRGFLRTDQATGQKLLLGFHMLDLAQSAWGEQDLSTIVADELRRLREMTGETAYLAALSGNQMVSISKSVGAHENSSTAAMGKTKPVYATSQGKAVLAFLPQRQLDHILSTLTFEPITSHTITDKNALRLRLNIVRQRGFAIDDEENIPGVRCIGVPLFDANGVPVAAISVSGPTYRMTMERAEQLAPELIEAGKRASLLIQDHKANAEQPSHSDIHPVGNPAFHGDKPLWRNREACLYWVDRLAPAIYAMPEDEQPVQIATTPGPIEHVIPARNGGINLVCEGVWYHARLGGMCERIDRPYFEHDSAFAAGPNGAVWTCREADGAWEIGQISARGAFTPEWTVAHAATNMAWSFDGKLLYALNSEEGIIYELVHGRRAPMVLCRIPRGAGTPCALAVDKLGRLWVALRDGWSVIRLDESGEVEQILALPVPRPTGLTFGGSDGATLYITTERLGVAQDILKNAPLSGHLLTVQIDV